MLPAVAASRTSPRPRDAGADLGRGRAGDVVLQRRAAALGDVGQDEILDDGEVRVVLGVRLVVGVVRELDDAAERDVAPVVDGRVLPADLHAQDGRDLLRQLRQAREHRLDGLVRRAGLEFD